MLLRKRVLTGFLFGFKVLCSWVQGSSFVGLGT